MFIKSFFVNSKRFDTLHLQGEKKLIDRGRCWGTGARPRDWLQQGSAQGLTHGHKSISLRLVVSKIFSFSAGENDIFGRQDSTIFLSWEGQPTRSLDLLISHLRKIGHKVSQLWGHTIILTNTYTYTTQEGHGTNTHRMCVKIEDCVC